MSRRRSRSTQPASTASPAPAADRETRLAVPLLADAIVLAYANSLSTPFQFDDFGAIETEVARQSAPQVTATVAQPSVQVAGRPIVRLSFALNYAWGGRDVTGYHVFNIAVHIVCTLLFFFLVRYTLMRWATGDWQQSAFRVALWSAPIWALHPLNTGSVTYVSARSESRMAMWYLSTLLAAMQAHGPR